MAFMMLIGQLLLALGFSGLVALWLGPLAFASVAAFVFFVCLILLVDGARREAEASSVFYARDEPRTIQIALSIMASSAIFAIIWPNLPFFFAWSSWNRHKDKQWLERLHRDED